MFNRVIKVFNINMVREDMYSNFQNNHYKEGLK